MNSSMRKISAGNADKLQRVLGTFDENLNLIMGELGVDIRIDGVNVVVNGAEERVIQAVSAEYKEVISL